MKEARHKRPQIDGSIYTKCPEQTNPQGQNVDQWLPRTRGGEKERYKGAQDNFRV